MSDLKIWKYSLRVEDRQVILMPTGAQLLTAQLQRSLHFSVTADADDDGTTYLWALVNPKAKPSRRRIGIFGTGNPLPAEMNEGRYIATFQLHGGILIFHVFDFGEEQAGEEEFIPHG